MDESGFSERPPVRRSWAPQGKTPVVTEHFNWKKLSAIATLIATPAGRRVRLTLRLLPGTVKSRQIPKYLATVRWYLNGKRLILLWDQLTAHRSQLVQRYVAQQKAWLMTEFLPPYAPELNPTEYLWAYVSNTDMANYSADYLGQIRRQVHKAAGRARSRQDVGRGFLKHAGLF